MSQLLWEDAEAFLSHTRTVNCPVCFGSAPASSPTWTCPNGLRGGDFHPSHSELEGHSIYQTITMQDESHCSIRPIASCHLQTKAKTEANLICTRYTTGTTLLRRPRGANVARLTPDPKVTCKHHSGGHVFVKFPHFEFKTFIMTEQGFFNGWQLLERMIESKLLLHFKHLVAHYFIVLGLWLIGLTVPLYCERLIVSI